MRISLIVAAAMAVVAGSLASQSLAQSAARQLYHGESNARLALNNVINVNANQQPAKVVFAYIAELGGLNLVVDWKRMAAAGIDPDQPITVTLYRVSVARALRLSLMQMSGDGDAEIMFETHDAYVEMLTKEQANKRAVVKVYVIGDLLQRIPNFTDAPKFDLSKIAGDGTESGPFQSDSSDDTEDDLPRSQRGEQIADLIRRTIEPDLWQANGGLDGSISYHDGRLIVRAPEYVHKQIGLSETDMYNRRRAAAARAFAAPPVNLYQPQVAYNPQIGVVNSGGQMDVQGTVDSRRMYVNINARPSWADAQLRNYPLYTGRPVAGSSTIAPAPGVGVNSFNSYSPNSYYNRPSGSGVSGISR